MDERKYSGCTTKLNYFMAALVLDVCAALVGSVILIVLRGAGLINMHWALVLSSIVWLSWGLFLLTILLELIARWCRRRKVDRRVIRQAKAAGVWNNPKALGGRALELYARKKHRLKRKLGESDKGLRVRCAKKTGAQTPTYSRPTPPPPPKPLDDLAWEDYGIKRLPGETDEQLKKRCMAAVDEEYASAPDWRTLENE